MPSPIRRGDDPLVSLLELPGVTAALDSARASVDQRLWDRQLRQPEVQARAEASLRSARASAWFEGAECGLAELRSGAAMDGSPVGRLLANSVALHAELPALVAIVGTAPGQALARMHALAAHGFVSDDELGRPRRSPHADDGLRIGTPPDPADLPDRLTALGRLLVNSTAPGILVAAVAHAEVAVLRPFGWGSGLVARALLPLVMAQRGVDPGLLCAPEVGLRAAGRPAFVRAVRAYGSGSPDGVAAMVQLVAAAVEAAASESATWLSEP